MKRVLHVAVVIVVVALLVTACGSSSRGRGPSAGSTPSGTPVATPTLPAASPPSAAATPTPAPGSGAVYRCDTADLTLSLGQAQGAGGQSSQDFLFTNITNHSCGLVGYPGLQMLNTQSGPLPTHVTRWGAKWPTVILAPGGVASFVVICDNGFGYVSRPPSCVFPARMEVTPPNAFTTLVVGMQGVEVCNNGVLEVSSVVAGSNPEVYVQG